MNTTLIIESTSGLFSRFCMVTSIPPMVTDAISWPAIDPSISIFLPRRSITIQVTIQVKVAIPPRMAVPILGFSIPACVNIVVE